MSQGDDDETTAALNRDFSTAAKEYEHARGMLANVLQHTREKHAALLAADRRLIERLSATALTQLRRRTQ